MEALFNPDYKPRTDLENGSYHDDEDEVDVTVPRNGTQS